MIYGNPGTQGAPTVTGGQYQYNYGNPNSQSSNAALNSLNIYSPYLANQMAINNSGPSNLSGIIKRNKYAP
jgi:hypothetical protein